MKKQIMLLWVLFISCAGIMHNASQKKTAAQSETGDMAIALQWKPTETKVTIDSVNVAALRQFRFSVAPFDDCRQDTVAIGKCTVQGPVRMVTTKTNIPGWCRVQLVAGLKKYGLTIVEDSPDYVIGGCVNKFYVNESKRYLGEAELRIVVSTTEGEQKWAAVLSAVSENWGRTFSADNYYECLSNTLVLITESLLKNTQLVKQLQTGGETKE